MSGMSNSLFEPVKLGNIELKNRIVMSPMTRSRSIDNIPGELVATYYAQRAGAGLIVTEGTSPSPNGLGYPRIPGAYSEAQKAGWKAVADAVHAKSGHIFVQLMHTGRVTAAANLPAGARVLGPSSATLEGEMYVDGKGMQPHTAPTPMTEVDMATAIEEYASSASLVVAAGFDGVELHGANGYLIEQFLNTGINERTDKWGGSVENRLRFALAVVDRTAALIGKERVGIRISPYGVFNGSKPDATTDELYATLAKELSKRGIAYVHLVDHSSMGAPKPKPELFAAIREAFKGTLVLSGGYDAKRAQEDLDAGKGDLVAFGRPFISNPDLVTKLKSGAALRASDADTYYTPGEKGYTDYPTG